MKRGGIECWGSLVVALAVLVQGAEPARAQKSSGRGGSRGGTPSHVSGGQNAGAGGSAYYHSGASGSSYDRGGRSGSWRYGDGRDHDYYGDRGDHRRRGYDGFGVFFGLGEFGGWPGYWGGDDPWYGESPYVGEPGWGYRAMYGPSMDVPGGGGRSAQPRVHPRAVVLGVRVPADAHLWVDGVATQQTGPFREFESPALDPGKEYVYEVSAEWMEKGQAIRRTRTVAVQAGDRLLLNFLNAEGANEGVPAERGAD